MPDDSWCHFGQRVQRIPIQASVKENVTRNYEEETFSYVVMTKGTQLVDTRDTFDRIIKPPKKNTGHVIIKTCGHDDGDLRHFVVLRRDGVEFYKVWSPYHLPSLLDFPFRMQERASGATDSPLAIQKNTSCGI